MPEITIDKVFFDKAKDAFVLSLTQGDPWESPGVLAILQDRLNGYITAIESGSILDQLPAAKGKPFIISIVFYAEIPEDVKLKIDAVGQKLRERGIGFELMQIKVGYQK